MRCPACGNENPPEYPPEEYPFCIECGAQLSAYRAGPMPGPMDADPYGRGPADPYGNGRQVPYQQQAAPPHQGQQAPYQGQGGQYPPQPAPYQNPPADPYGAGRPAPYQQPQPAPGPYGVGADPYAGGGRPDPYARPQPEPQLGAPQAGPARLILESGLGKVEYPLDAPVVTIGRSRSNDISLEDARVSRHHARVVRDGTGYLIEDLNSRNGTRVDDHAVRDSASLSDGAIVRIGDSVFRFTMAAGAQQPGRLDVAPSPFGGAQGAPGGFGGGAPGGGGYGVSAPAPGVGSNRPVQEVFLAPWSPVQCPTCQGIKTMRPIVYGPAAQSPGARAAAQRGELTLGEGPGLPSSPNAECRTCGTRVRIVTTGG
jgi:hypothetical protein